MLIKKEDIKYKFRSYFDTKTGNYMRTGVLDENGKDTGVDPFMASFPELIDIGIMGSCIHGLSGKCKESKVQCYQHGDISRKPNMTLENYKRIIDECKGKTFQVALGGCGDPDQHKDFEVILRYTVKNNIVPNFTTSGFGMTDEIAKICKQFCGSVAVSMYSRLDKELQYKYREMDVERVYNSFDDIPISFSLGEIQDSLRDIDKRDIVFNTSTNREYIAVYNEVQHPNYTIKAIRILLDNKVQTNIHYVLGNSTIDEAILRLKYNGFPAGINAVIFLLAKPVGLGSNDEVLDYNDTRVQEFFKLVDYNNYPFKLGFDSCTIPGLLNFCHNIDRDSIDTCEAARWSMYITPDMYALPCSFDNQDMKYAVKLDTFDKYSIRKAWYSKEFNTIRDKFKHSCPDCKHRTECLGGCPLMDNIQLCCEQRQ